MKKLISLLCTTAISLTIVNCGSGGISNTGTSSTNPRIVLRTFNDGSGVGRATDNDWTVNTLVSESEIQVWKNQHDPEGVDNAVDFSKLTKYDELMFGDRYSGTVDINDRTEDTLGLIDRRSGVGWLNLGNQILTIGTLTSRIPSGRLAYNGHNILSGKDLEHTYVGTFGISVNFTSGLGRITGSTTSIETNSRIFGTFNIDKISGNFRGDSSLTFTSYNIDGAGTIEYPASIFGSFHGEGATGISGIYFPEIDNNGTPNLNGSIIGAKSN